MTEKKIIDASKQEDKTQDKFADELLSEKELENVAGGAGGKIWEDIRFNDDLQFHHTGKK